MRRLPSYRSSPAPDRARQAVEIARYFREGRHLSGTCYSPDNNCVGPGPGDLLPYATTGLGAWARSRPAHLFYFFRRINLSGYRLFIDLGSGDGIAACVAGLFTRSAGMESDPDLVAAAATAARALKMADRVRFIRADFYTQRIEAADCLFIYPDKPIHALEDRLKDWSGALLVYGPHFPPRRMIAAAGLKCGKETLSVYRNMP